MHNLYNLTLGGVILVIFIYISVYVSYLWLPDCSEEFRVLWISIGILISTIIVCTVNIVKRLNSLLQKKENKPQEEV